VARSTISVALIFTRVLDDLEYNNSVLFRRAFSAILIVSLFLMSSWASACDLSCTLAKLHSGCQTQSAASSERTTADSMPPDMPMGENMESSQGQDSHTGDSDFGRSAAMGHWDSKLCIHEPCSQISAPAFPPQVDHSQLDSLHSMAINVSIPVSLSTSFHWIRIGPSPPSLLAILSLRATTLRI
jgi:hypothetical protein